MYLKNEHFDHLLINVGEDKKDFDRCERLSSKAMMYTTGTRIFIFYVDTLVFKKELDGSITLNTNGWKTMTSKGWINYGLHLAGNNSRLQQKNFEWYLVDGDKKTDYEDNMQITTLKAYTEKQVASGRFKDLKKREDTLNKRLGFKV